MFGKLINSYYYGKSGKGDFNKEDLPQNRWQLFWDTLRVRFSALVRLNLMYFVAWLPAIIFIALGVMSMYSCLASMADLQMQLEAGELTAEAFAAANADTMDLIRGLVMQTLIFLIPCIAITGPVTAGLCYVTRNWARDEHAFIWADFRDAIKANWKQGLATSAITGFVPLIVYVCFQFYGQMAATSSGLFIVPQVLCVLVATVWMCSLMYTYPLMVTYQLKFRELMRNTLLLTVGRLPMSVGLRLLSLVMPAIAVVVALYTPYFQYAMMALLAYYALLGFALSRFVGASYTNAVFDRYINPKIEGAKVNQGLYVDEDEDDEQSADALDEPATDQAERDADA